MKIEPEIFLERQVEHKKIIWFKSGNRYMLVEIQAFDVISRLIKGDIPEAIAMMICKDYQLPLAEALRFVGEVAEMVSISTGLNTDDPQTQKSPLKVSNPASYYSVRKYRFNCISFIAEYESAHLERLIHPKFSHLEVTLAGDADHTFQVFQNGDRAALRVDGEIIGQWLPNNEHFLSGKFSMELLNRIYRKTEDEWMGVFHASAISKGDQSMLFLGDSGSGKSTICAILMANGFNLLADDFVPVDAQTRKVIHFPAAVSIKKTALDYLTPLYPQLAFATEFAYSNVYKTVRYLSGAKNNEILPVSCPCKALVFVKYKKSVKMKLEKLTRDIAFQYLIPDSWISPLPENAASFLDWFLSLPCYNLTYSDNELMIAAIEKIFTDDLS